jgi:HlyD family secretion protein
MKRKKIIPLAILAIITTAAILYFDVIRKIESSPDKIEGSGTIEVTEVDIASKMTGRIADITADEGDSV